MEKFVQITAGKGPVECSWVVAEVLKFFLREATEKGISATTLHRVEGDLNGTIQSVTLLIESSKEEIEKFLKSWEGTIQWIGKSQFRKHHNRKNWFVAVNVLDLDTTEDELDEKEIKYEATRSGGPGGQHVNKVSTAVRAYHPKTGLSVVASESRSQIQNKKKARERLVNLLKLRYLENKKRKIKDSWNQHNQLERENPVRIFNGSDFKSEFVDKTYKTKRKHLKQDLRKWDLEND